MARAGGDASINWNRIPTVLGELNRTSCQQGTSVNGDYVVDPPVYCAPLHRGWYADVFRAYCGATKPPADRRFHRVTEEMLQDPVEAPAAPMG